MHTLLSLAFVVWTDGKKHGVWFEAEGPAGSPGLEHISFCMYQPELVNLVGGKTSECSDLTTKLDKLSEYWTFYRFELPRGDAGTFQVPYRRIFFPRTFMRLMLRRIQRVWAMQAAALANGAEPYDVPRVRIEVSANERARATRLYGQGHGRIRVVTTGAETVDFLTRCQEEAGPTFKRQFASLEQIARNSTYGHHETATLYIHRDGREWWEGFYWSIANPRGVRVMNGGLINHGHREGRPDHDWSVHT